MVGLSPWRVVDVTALHFMVAFIRLLRVVTLPSVPVHLHLVIDACEAPTLG